MKLRPAWPQPLTNPCLNAETAAGTRRSAAWQRSLAVQVARKMVLWACVNTLVLTAAGYLFVFQRVEQRTRAYLSGYLSERVRAESQAFVAGEANIAKFERAFLSLYSDPKVLPAPDFDAYFEPKHDGTLRLKRKFYFGVRDRAGVNQKGVTGFVIGDRRSLTPEFKRRIMLTRYLVSQFGPAWTGQFANLYAALPENAGVTYWPGVPWGLEVTNKRVQAVRPVWTPLYYDAVAGKWNVSYQKAVTFHGRALVYPGQDILLDELMSRLINDHPAGAYNLVIAKNGDLIAHPGKLDELKKGRIGTNVRTLSDPQLRSIYRSILASSGAHHPGGVNIVEDRQIDAYVCYGEIKGPGWWFVTIYPRSLVLQSAREAANGLLLLGLASFAVMTMVVLWVLRERVARPIAQMKTASETVYAGDYASVADGRVLLPEQENNEIGILAHSFRGMAGKIRDTTTNLEDTVRRRTKELRAANEELEQLSFKDALTGACNRRSFDRDLVPFIVEAQHSGGCHGLVLCDVDYFKSYNDTYGHQAGDRVLRLLASRMMREDARVYRYGGEELGVLLKAPDRTACEHAARRIVESIASLAVPHEKSPHQVVTVSAGLSIVDPGRQTAPALLEAADTLLYQAKSNGRNQLAFEKIAAAGDQNSAPFSEPKVFERRKRRSAA